jgi:DNA polymerase-3 subunit gamma/tau
MEGAEFSVPSKSKGIVYMRKMSYDSVQKIARAADGSLRDATTMFEQVLSGCSDQDRIEGKDVDRILGITDGKMVENMAIAILSQNGALVIEQTKELMNKGENLVYFAQQLMKYFRNLLLLKLCEKTDDLLEITDKELRVLKYQADEVSTPKLIQLIEIMLENEGLLRQALNTQIMLEVILLKLSGLSCH